LHASLKCGLSESSQAHAQKLLDEVTELVDVEKKKRGLKA
jgi:hypothetical protein